MRITGGRARGIPLGSGRARGLRPATDRLREAVFSSLGPLVPGARVLDLFAGTGAYGLEAWSRGADSVTAVERDPRAIAALETNRAAVARSLARPEADVTLSRADLYSWRPSTRFTLVFADPPYAEMHRAASRVAALAGECLEEDPEARLLLEMPGEFEPRLPGFTLLRRLGQGRGQPTVGVFARVSPETASSPAP
jgi:16S rRNA (guanine966-N2)-methyltransferase